MSTDAATAPAAPAADFKMANTVDDQLSAYVTYDDLVDNNIDIKTIAQLLETVRITLKKGKITTEEARVKALVQYLAGADVGDYLWLCDRAEGLKMKSWAFQLRRLLKPKRFQWRWVNDDGEEMSMSPHSRFPDEESCKADAWAHAPDASTQAKLWIVAFLRKGDEIGTVFEDGLKPEKRKQEVDDGPLKKKQKAEFKPKITYELMMSRELGDDVRMEVFKQGDEYSIDIRRWTLDEHQKLKPTKKGLRLSLQCFIRLLRLRDDAQDMINKMKAGEHVDERVLVGGPVYMKINSPFITIHLREYYLDEEEKKIKPGRRGIILKMRQWQQMLAAAAVMDAAIPGFSRMTPCYAETDHSNQEGMLACTICNYFRDDGQDEDVCDCVDC